MVAAFLLDPTEPAEPGEAVVQRLAGVTLPERATIAGRAKWSFEAVPVERAAPWAGSIVHALLPIAEELPRRLEASGLAALYRDVELPVAELLAEIERDGHPHRRRSLQQLSAEVSAKITELERFVYEAAGTELNLGLAQAAGRAPVRQAGPRHQGRAPDQDRGGRPRPRRSRRSSDAHPVVKPILEHRELTKLKGTYLDALPPLVSPTHGPRAHDVQPGGGGDRADLVAGSQSAEHPDPQRAGPADPARLRRGARATVLVAADYSQIELRILAAPLGRSGARRGVPRSRRRAHADGGRGVRGAARGRSPPSSAGSPRRSTTACPTASPTSASRARSTMPRDQGGRVLAALLPAVPGDPQVHGGHRHARARAGRGAHAPRAVAADPEPHVQVAAGAPRRRARRAEHADAGRRAPIIIKLAMLATGAADRDGGAGRCGCCSPSTTSWCSRRRRSGPRRSARRSRRRWSSVFTLSVPLVVDIGIAGNWADACWRAPAAGERAPAGGGPARRRGGLARCLMPRRRR